MAEKHTYKFSKTTRARMSKAHTGLKLSAATKAKISAARRERQALIEAGLLQPYRHTEETKRKLRKLMKARKHKPSRKALKRSAQVRKARSEDKKAERLARKLARN